MDVVAVSQNSVPGFRDQQTVLGLSKGHLKCIFLTHVFALTFPAFSPCITLE